MKQSHKKLYESLIPFLVKSGLYGKLVKIVRENLLKEDNKTFFKTVFQFAVYLIVKEFGSGNYVAKFTDFEKREENKIVKNNP
jgi:hypothetical protein